MPEQNTIPKDLQAQDHLVQVSRDRTTVWVHTSSTVVPLADASADTRELTEAALRGLKEIFRAGYAYKKCGVMLLELGASTAGARKFV